MKFDLTTSPFFSEFESKLNSRSIGFDRTIKALENALNSTLVATSKYPPYNLIKVSNTKTLIELAVAGFKQDELEIVLENQILTISGNSKTEIDQSKLVYIGIANRNFKQTFALEEHVEVYDAKLEDGILSITVEKNIPEEKLPKKIQITKSKK